MGNNQFRTILFIFVFVFPGILVTNVFDHTRFLYHQSGQKINFKESILQKASVDGKYEELIGKLKIPGDKKKYSSFTDDEYWHGGTYNGIQNLPAGYWVFVAPPWYVWKPLKTDLNVSTAVLPTVKDKAYISRKEGTSNVFQLAPDLSQSDTDRITLEKAYICQNCMK